MSQHADQTPELPSNASVAQVKKARMLVSMLGADFAKTSTHPFFRDLARTAVQPLPAKAQQPDMSKALAKLVRTLAEPKSVLRDRNPAAQKSACPPAAQPAAISTKDADLITQHPVLIAKHILGLPAAERVSWLRRMPARTARQVASYVTEMKDAPK